jgi:KUP system potassium uptake protein
VEVPRVPDAERTLVEHVADGFWHVTVRFGFVEIPSLKVAMEQAIAQGCPTDAKDVVYFASRDDVVPAKTGPRMPGWQRILFAFMFRNAIRMPDRFNLAAENFLEVNRQVAL